MCKFLLQPQCENTCTCLLPQTAANGSSSVLCIQRQMVSEALKQCSRCSWSWSCHRRTGLITSEGDGARSDACTEGSCSWREALSRSFPKHRCTLAGTNPWPGLTKDDYFLWISCQTVPTLSFQEHQLPGSDHLFASLLHSSSMTQWKKRADAGD